MRLIILLILFVVISCMPEKKKEKSQLGGVLNYNDQKNSYSGVIVGYYHEVEQKKYEEVYRNGIKNGIYKSWFKNGRLKSIGQYSNNIRVGLWKWFNEKGELTYAFEYKPKKDQHLTSLK